MKLTLDSTCIHDYFHRDKANIQVLIDDARAGRCELAVTSRIRHDIPAEPLASELQRLPGLNINKIGTVARWGVSNWGEDYWSGNVTEEYEKKISEIMFPGASHPRHLNDIDHLLGHIINKRDYFITSDPDFLRHRDDLREKLNVKIATPGEYVEQIRLL